MENKSIDKKIGQATKWSSITEIMAKLVAPISSMVLARLLVPEMYGVVASVNMVISFSELFTDAGFQKYLIQHEFENEEDLTKATNVAFWTNLIISFIAWGLIILFASPIAKLVGNPGKEFVLCVSCVSIPLAALSSIQNARFKREMDFKTLFSVRLVAILVPFFVTIPLAFITRNYWSLVIGTIVINIANAVVLTVRSKWKPKFYYNAKVLKTMLSFSLWSMAESILAWLINWGDTFIVGLYLSQHFLGLYKTSMTTVNQIIGIISAATVPVMLTALSRLQNDELKFKETYYKFNFLTSILLLPMGAGMYIYRNLICSIMLGPAWSEAANFMGIWGLISAVAILYNSYNGNVLISKGKPQISVIVQVVQIAFIVPAVYYSVKISYDCLVYTRALVRLIGMLIFIIVNWKMFGLSFVLCMKKSLGPIVATGVMGIAGYVFVNLGLSEALQFFTVFVCMIIYFGVVICFPSVRSVVFPYYNLIKNKVLNRRRNR